VSFSTRKLLTSALAVMLVAVFAACSGGEELPAPSTATEGLSTGVEKSDVGSQPSQTSPATPTETTSTQPTPAATEKVPLAPVFSVVTVDGETVRLEDLVGTVPVYVLFVPSTDNELDRNQLSVIQTRHDVFVELEAKVVVVVADLPTNVIDMRDELGLEFALIADPLYVVASDWQVFDLDGEGKVSPASFVFDAFGNLIARLVATVPEDRPTVDEVLFTIEESINSAAA